MIVRPATEADIPAIVEMAYAFYTETLYADICEMAKESAAGLAILMMRDGVMLVAEDDDGAAGMIGLVIAPFTFNVAVTMAEEIVFWVQPRARGGTLALRIKNEAERLAKEKGVNWLQMSTLPSSPSHVDGLYESTGYKPSGRTFAKVIQ